MGSAFNVSVDLKNFLFHSKCFTIIISGTQCFSRQCRENILDFVILFYCSVYFLFEMGKITSKNWQKFQFFSSAALTEKILLTWLSKCCFQSGTPHRNCLQQVGLVRRDQIEIDLLDHSDPGPKILTIQNAEILAAKLSGLQTTIPASLRSDSILPNFLQF